MGNRVLNTALLSLATVSVLSTNAFARDNLQTTVNSSTSNTGFVADIATRNGTSLTKETNSVEVFDLIVISSDYEGTTLNDLNITLKKDTNTSVSFLSTVDLYKGQIGSSYKIGSANLNVPTDTNTPLATKITVTANTKLDKDNKLFVVINNSGVADSVLESNVTVKFVQMTISQKRDVNSEALTSGTVSITGNDSNGSKILTIDRTAPTIELNTSALQVVNDSCSEDNNFTNNALTLQFKEALRSNLISAPAFSAVDSKGDTIKITGTSFSNFDKNITITFDKADLNNTASGNIYLKFDATKSLIKDVFGNNLDTSANADFNLSVARGVIIFKDTVSPKICKVSLNFEDKTKGSITFNEEVKAYNSTFAGVSFKSSDTKAKTFGTLRVVDNKSVLDFDLNATQTGDVGFSYLGTDNNGTIIDMAENNGSNLTGKYEVKTMDFNLTSGWNLVAMDTDTRTTSRRIMETGSVQVIWGYDSATGTWTKFPKDIIDGQGYWIKDLNGSKFSTVEITNDEIAVNKTSTTDTNIIKSAIVNKWNLLGVSSPMLWKDAQGQVANTCNGVSIYYYENNGSGWNTNTGTIPANHGIWVKQENCN